MIYFLYGEDDFSSTEKLNEIKDQFLNKNAQGSSLSVLDFDEGIDLDLRSVIRLEGLFSSNKLVMVKNIFKSGGIDTLRQTFDLFEEMNGVFDDKELAVVFWESENPKKNTKLFKMLEKNAKTHLFEKISGTKLSRWIQDRVEKMGGKISKDGLEKLISFVGDDLWKMSHEIEKLVSYKDGEEIAGGDVSELVSANITKDIFGAIDALGRRDKNTAIKMLHNQLESGDDPFYVLSMYVYQFRNLLKIGSFYFQGMRNNYEIARVAKLHPFVVQKGIQQLQGFSEMELKRIYKRLENLDYQAKTGHIDIVLGLDKFVAEI
ncbi:MAG: DNA polymerase III subunit delta [Candidatus Moranbacteria bacterium]|nr:DNA polymerase III subunit delta [Candidatus Moranbacteria bacterium]